MNFTFTSIFRKRIKLRFSYLVHRESLGSFYTWSTNLPVTREAGAAVTVRTYWAWKTTATLRLLGGARGAGEPTGGGGAGHIVSPRAQLVLFITALNALKHTVVNCWN